MKREITKNRKKESRSLFTTLTPPAALLIAVMTIALLVPTSFAANNTLASRIWPNEQTATYNSAGDVLEAKWNMKKKAVDLEQMYRQKR